MKLKATVISLTAIFALLTIALYATSQGIDSVLTITISTLIGGIAGVSLKPVLSIIASYIFSKRNT